MYSSKPHRSGHRVSLLKSLFRRCIVSTVFKNRSETLNTSQCEISLLIGWHNSGIVLGGTTVVLYWVAQQWYCIGWHNSGIVLGGTTVVLYWVAQQWYCIGWHNSGIVLGGTTVVLYLQSMREYFLLLQRMTDENQSVAKSLLLPSTH